ncbi:drug:proton antiporter [Chromatiales bacterium (ex Bugula neritina AB1)]|nr:drug:proton antiporter [Chromatiales bacterium (ex Bugula neritina AB1)]
MSEQDVKVVFTPSGRRGRFPPGTPVLEAGRALGVDIDSVCGGRAICGRCQVLCAEGDFPKHEIQSSAASLSPFTKTEERWERVKKLSLNGRRLSCQARLQGDAVIDVPPDSQVHRQVIRKGADLLDIVLNPVVRLYYVEVQEPDMHSPTGDLQRLISALEYEWHLNNIRCDPSLIYSLQQTLRAKDWKVTAAITDDGKIIALWSGFKEQVLGMAVDIGSTTIAAHLCDLTTGIVQASTGLMNPQIRFGEDLMSRVSYVMMNPDGDKDMTRVVREAICDLVTSATAEIDARPDDVLVMTMVANPVMHHLLLGINPIELGGAPFALATDEAILCKGAELDLNTHPNTQVYVLPCIAGHVGADTASVILAERPDTMEEMTLLVDVGTNAEIVLGNRHRLLACSSPTGPAFEGAQISGGQRAAPGAIERVRIDPETLEPRYSIIGSEKWSDESGFAESVEGIGVTGICGSGIIEVIAEMFLAGIIDTNGVIRAELAAKSNRLIEDGRTYSYKLHDGDVKVIITQNDVRQIQLAKAALYAGVRLLMDRLEVEHIDRIRLAGAFGSHIDVKYAMVLGLIPDCNLKHVSSAGNAAGSGARIALLNRDSRGEIEALVKQVEKVETAVEQKFQDHFVEAMGIPHKTATFPNLKRVVKLPDPTPSSDNLEGRRARRRRRRS